MIKLHQTGWQMSYFHLLHAPVFNLSACFVSPDAVDLGSPDELMDISEVDEGLWPGKMGIDVTPPTITISNSVTTLNLGAKAMKKCRLGGRTSKDKEASPLTTGRAASESAELSVKRLTLTSSQSVPKAGALTNLTRTASAVFSRSFEQVASGGAPPTSNHNASEAGRYSCSMQEEGMGYMLTGPNHTQRSPSISVHLGSDLWNLLVTPDYMNPRIWFCDLGTCDLELQAMPTTTDHKHSCYFLCRSILAFVSLCAVNSFTDF